MKKPLLTCGILCLALSLHAFVRLPKILSNNMVLQQNSNAKLWGWASPGEKIKITASWDNKIIETVADGNANWLSNIKTPKAGGPYTIAIEGENKILLENILIGEVWVCSGQSNMEWSYSQGIKSVKEDFAQLNKLNIRLLKVPKTTSNSPQDDCEASWAVCDSNTLKIFSAVGYYFGKKLNQELNVPIGLISSNWGGTPAEVWTPADLIENNTTLKDAAKKNQPTQSWPVAPGYAYNAMIAPLQHYAIAGTIWYQGESNTKTASTYATLMDTMINSWRKIWDKEFPFYYVQIAPFRYENNNIAALLRAAQTEILTTPKTGMVVISDLVNDTLNIHPTNKKDVGSRLANMALAETYGVKTEAHKSPLFKTLVVKDGRAVVSFENAENGLLIKGKEAKEIFIAGVDRVFYPAEVKAVKGSLIISNKQVKIPVAIRYQFNNAGIGNIFSKDGLPVAPFRTDNWEVDTGKRK